MTTDTTEQALERLIADVVTDKLDLREAEDGEACETLSPAEA